jgi:hypothetical protein
VLLCLVLRTAPMLQLPVSEPTYSATRLELQSEVPFGGASRSARIADVALIAGVALVCSVRSSAPSVGQHLYGVSSSALNFACAAADQNPSGR